MKSRIVIAMSALTLGTALAAVPSFAQTYNQPKAAAPQQESRGCVHFQQGCSDRPYPVAENASSNGEQKSAQTGTRENRSASSRERTSGARVSANERGRVSVDERSSSERTSGARTRVGERESGSARLSGRARVSGGARLSERAQTSDQYMRSAAPEPSGTGERVAVTGETYGVGAPRYYNSAPGVEIAGAPSSAVAMCETRFHSFDPATGTYLGFDGIRHPCP